MAASNAYAAYCLKPIRRVLNAETFLLNMGRIQTFYVGSGASSDFVVRDSDISGRHAEFKRFLEGWCIRDISGPNYAILINLETITKKLEIYLKEGDIISFHKYNSKYQYFYLYSKYQFVESFRIGELINDGVIVERCTTSPLSIALSLKAIEALKENIEYLGHALFVKNKDFKTLSEVYKESEEQLKNSHRNELVQLKEDYLKVNNELTLKLNSETRLNECEKRKLTLILQEKENDLIKSREKLRKYQNIYEDYHNRLREKDGEIVRLHQQIEEFKQKFKNNHSVINKLKEEKMNMPNSSNDLRFQEKLQQEVRDLKRQMELQSSINREIEEEKDAQEKLIKAKDNEIKYLNHNFQFCESRNLDDQRVISERARTIEDLQRKCKEIQNEFTELQNECLKLKEDNHKMKQSLHLNQQAENLFKEKLEMERKKRNEENIFNEQRIRQLEERKVKNLEHQLEKLNKEKKDYTKVTEEEITSLKAKVDNQHSIQMALETRLKEKSFEFNVAEKEISLLKKQLYQLMGNIEQNVANNMEFGSILQNKESDSTRINFENQRALKSYKEESENLKSALKVKEKEIEELKTIVEQQKDLLEEAITNYNKRLLKVKNEQLLLKENNSNLNIKRDEKHTQTEFCSNESDQISRLEEENGRLSKFKETLKKGILELQIVSDAKESKFEKQIQLKTKEIKEFQQANVKNESFYKDIKSALRCSICTEVYKKAVALNCSHSFCDHCIEEWRRAKNNCPTCKKIIDQKVDIVVLDQIAEVTLRFKP